MSYVHFLNTDRFKSNQSFTQLLIYPSLPLNFYASAFDQQLDWGIEHWLPCLVNWTNGWVKASERNDLIGFSKFETMVSDHSAFVDDVMSFLKFTKIAYT